MIIKGVIHTYITGLLFRPTAEDGTPNLFFTLPQIHGTRPNRALNESPDFSDGRQLNFGLRNNSKTPDFIKRALEEPELSYNSKFLSNSTRYPKRVKTIEEFK